MLEEELCVSEGEAQTVGVAEAQAMPLPLLLMHTVALALSVAAVEPEKCAVAVLLLVPQNELEGVGGGVFLALALAKTVLEEHQLKVGGVVGDETALRVVSMDVEGLALASNELEGTAVGVAVSEAWSDGKELKVAHQVARAVGEAHVSAEAEVLAELYNEGLSVPEAQGQGVGLDVAHSLTATVGVGGLLGHADALLQTDLELTRLALPAGKEGDAETVPPTAGVPVALPSVAVTEIKGLKERDTVTLKGGLGLELPLPLGVGKASVTEDSGLAELEALASARLALSPGVALPAAVALSPLEAVGEKVLR